MDRETPNPSKANSVSTKNKVAGFGNPVQEYLALQPINYAENFSGTADLNRGSDSSLFHGTNFMQDQILSNFKSKERSSTQDQISEQHAQDRTQNWHRQGQDPSNFDFERVERNAGPHAIRDSKSEEKLTSTLSGSKKQIMQDLILEQHRANSAAVVAKKTQITNHSDQ